MCGSHAAWPRTVSPSGEDGGHDRVLRAHDRCLVEVQRAAAEPVGRDLVDTVDVDIGAERGERVDVCVEPTPADDVAARRRHGDAAEACEQRAGEEERRANLARELGIEVGLPHSPGIDTHLVRADPFGVGTEVGEELDHRLDVPDARNVGEMHLLGRQHARGEDRERAVLVPRSAHRPGQRAAALDDEGLHRARNATRGLHGLQATPGG